jgi:putative membrane protein
MATTLDSSRLVAVALLALAILLAVPLLLWGGGMTGTGAMGPGTMWGDGWMHGGQTGAVSGWWLLVGLVGRLLTLAVLVGLGYLGYRALTRDGGRDPALEELRSAYARGDIDDDEFERRRERLRED